MSVVKDLGVPIKFIGVGEKIEDLRDFDPEVRFPIAEMSDYIYIQTYIHTLHTYIHLA